MAMRRTIHLLVECEVDAAGLTQANMQARVDHMQAHLPALKEDVRDHLEIHFDNPRVHYITAKLMPVEES